jgi:hypothetical protein
MYPLRLAIRRIKVFFLYIENHVLIDREVYYFFYVAYIASICILFAGKKFKKLISLVGNFSTER